MSSPEAGNSKPGAAHKAAAVALALVSILVAAFVFFAWGFPYYGCISMDTAHVIRGINDCHQNMLVAGAAVLLLLGGLKGAATVWRGR